jgi:glycosyltransferase involved in cell wall biosynthesis
MNPKLSIISVNLNNATGLRKTIESVVSQTLTDYEYIIIDGGSTDGSVDVIKEFADKITYWVSEPDKGIYNAMNKGILKSNGEYLQFLNSGDEYYTPYSQEMAFDCISQKSTNINLFFFDYIYQNCDKKTLISSNDVTNKFIIYNKGFGHPSTFYKKTLFDTLGLFEERYKISGDRAFYMKALVRIKEPFAYFTFPLSVFYEGGFSTNQSNQATLLSEDSEIINTYYNRLEKKIISYSYFYKIMNLGFITKLFIILFNWKLKRV